jgi:hypothetical protein
MVCGLSAIFIRALATREPSLFFPIFDPRASKELIRAASIHIPTMHIFWETKTPLRCGILCMIDYLLGRAVMHKQLRKK